MERNEEVHYGQKLNFIHGISAFEPESVPLVKFVLNWIENNRARYVQSGYYNCYYQSYSEPKLRSIPLKGDELECFMEAMNGREFEVAIDNSGEKPYRLTEERLDRKLRISGKEKGIEIAMDRFPYVLTDGYMFVFHGGFIYRLEKKELEPVLDFIKCVADIPGQTAFIETSDAASFCRELLPALDKFFDCSYEDFVKENYGIVEVSFEIYLDAPQKDMVTCQVKAVYGEEKYQIYGKEAVDSRRDVVREIEVGSSVSASLVFNWGSEQIIDEAQYIKNHNTQAAKAVKEIQAGTKFALTGTPIENRLSELWSIFDYLMPGFRG